jgi:hypothetical protein
MDVMVSKNCIAKYEATMLFTEILASFIVKRSLMPIVFKQRNTHHLLNPRPKP